MNENTPGREPVQILQMSLPRCANTFGVAPCAASAAIGGECFNTRATCQDPENYRATPINISKVTVEYRNGSIIDAGATLVRDADAIFHARVSLAATPDGTIFAAGSSSHYVYMGFDSGDLRVFAGGTGANQAIQDTIDLSAYANSTVELFFEIEPNNTGAVWLYDPVTYQITQLASLTVPSAGTFPSNLFCADTDGQVGGDGGNTYGSEASGDFNGYIGFVRYYASQTLDVSESDQYVTQLYFGLPQQGKPRDDLRIRPMLQRVSPVASKINISTESRNLSPLGSRASLNFDMADAVSTDRDVDPYYSTRPYRVEDGGRGLFWERMRPRHLYGFLGCDVRVYDGYAGQYLSEMQTRFYILDTFDLFGSDTAAFRARDVLTRAEPEKAQYPKQSQGQLAADLTDVATSMTTTGHILVDYPSSGTVRIGEELITYSAIVDNMDDTFTWTITGRGTDGSTADDHETDDVVQECVRITGASVYEALEQIFSEGTDIEGQYLDLAGWFDVIEQDLTTYTVSTILTEPNSTTMYAGELARDCGFYMWWDERETKVKIRAINSLTIVPMLLNDDDNLIAGSVSYRERPEDRVDELWFAYQPRDYTQKNDRATDYSEVYIRQIADRKYTLPAVRKIFSRWLTLDSDVISTTSRIGRQYDEVPVELTFKLDAKDRSLWVGDVIRVQNLRRRDQFGNIDERLYVITSANEVASGEILQYTAEDTTTLGVAYLVTPNSQPDYTGDPSTDGIYFFITDNNGKNPDGTDGAVIR